MRAVPRETWAIKKQASFEPKTLSPRRTQPCSEGRHTRVPPRALPVPGAELPRLLSHVEEEAGARLSQVELEEATKPAQVEEEAARLFTGGGGGGRWVLHWRRRRPPGPHRRRRRRRPPGPSQVEEEAAGPFTGEQCRGRRSSSPASGRGLSQSQGEWMVALTWVTHQNHLRSSPRHAQICGPGRRV